MSVWKKAKNMLTPKKGSYSSFGTVDKDNDWAERERKRLADEAAKTKADADKAKNAQNNRIDKYCNDNGYYYKGSNNNSGKKKKGSYW